nr:hypothetical protein [candidate division Zixibacteria bacterium]
MPTSICQACARLMRSKNDYPRGNFSSEFCSECVDERGHLKPRKIIRENMIRFRIEHHNISEEEAIEIVDNLMPALPAWMGQKATVL